MSRLTMVLVSLSSLALFSVTAEAADRCADILLDGTFDISTLNDDQSLIEAWNNYYSQNRSGKTNSERFSNWSSEASVIDLFRGESGGGSGFKNSTEMEDALVASSTGNIEYDKRLGTFVRRASAVIAESWRKCMEGNESGLRASLRLTPNPHEFYVVFHFSPINVQVQPNALVDEIKTSSKDFRCPASSLGSRY